jgi:hypothetical protein
VETPPVPLSPEKQATIKQHVQREKPPEAQMGGPVTVGMVVPEHVELWGLPQDSVTELPGTTSYKFLLTGKTIAVIDPESRKVSRSSPINAPAHPGSVTSRRVRFDAQMAGPCP